MEQEEMNVELALASGKKVVLRPAQVGDEQRAAELMPPNVAESKFAFGLAMSFEMLKMRLIAVDGKPLKMTDKEQLGKVLTRQDLDQIYLWMEKEQGKPVMPQANFVKGTGGK